MHIVFVFLNTSFQLLCLSISSSFSLPCCRLPPHPYFLLPFIPSFLSIYVSLSLSLSLCLPYLPFSLSWTQLSCLRGNTMLYIRCCGSQERSVVLIPRWWQLKDTSYCRIAPDLPVPMPRRKRLSRVRSMLVEWKPQDLAAAPDKYSSTGDLCSAMSLSRSSDVADSVQIHTDTVPSDRMLHSSRETRAKAATILAITNRTIL